MKRLNSEQWGEHYNVSQLENLVISLRKGDLSFQTNEMMKLSKVGEKILEIGSGSGATSLYLSMNGRDVTALDYSKECLDLTNKAAQKIGCKLDIVCADAEKELPFDENYFDVSFQAGLLEHYQRDERIKLLKIWGRVSKRMVSIIPNSASLAYRIGKARLEQQDKWTYGLELPQYTLISEFGEAGFDVISEYTIGAKHALSFLPKWHFMRIAIELWLKNNPCEDVCHQGYLLVTIGAKR